MFDKTPPIRFIFLNWFLISFISPLVLILFQVIRKETPSFENFNFGMILIYIFAIFWSMVFSLFSVAIFGLIVSLLNDHVENEKVIKFILIICVWPIIHFTFVFYIQDNILKSEILSATFSYWLVALFTIWLIPINKD